MPSGTAARGYGPRHQRAKAEWQAIIDQHGALCTMPVCVEQTREIPVGSRAWDLNHTDDRTSYTGPAHVRCNRGAPTRGKAAWQREEMPASQEW